MKPDGSKQTVDAAIGDSMLEVAHKNKIDIEGGCEEGGEEVEEKCRDGSRI